MLLFTLLCTFPALLLAESSEGNGHMPEGDLIELTDKTFEHDTQAYTGQTTGHWLVLFTASPEGSRHVEALMRDLKKDEKVGETLLMAKVDVAKNLATQKRFGVSENFKVILFRDRKMFIYEDDLTLESLRKFVTGGFLNQAGLKVPRESAPIESFMEELQKGYRVALSFVIQSPLGMSICGVLVALFAYAVTRSILGLDVKQTKVRRGLRPKHGPIRRKARAS
ncbi:hypothetical protein CBR_g38142 [Chara braunii]|uniref:Thioredoxin domain-containing protein n=1 Tax=Chara braunii TaxID=69332 RepID=A0A388LPB2_CHABU|nr:hypothetical protein CBR_g38142 [Chara braunii]|eukprot:GBG84168.1 hypothetical protein CBR_g38142 [Chara braunii]